MSVYAKNDVQLDKTGSKFPLDEGDFATKVDVHVFTQRVLIHVSETYPPVWDSPADREQMLEKGFHSIGYETPVTGIKLRAEDAATGNARVHFTAYG